MNFHNQYCHFIVVLSCGFPYLDSAVTTDAYYSCYLDEDTIYGRDEQSVADAL